MLKPELNSNLTEGKAHDFLTMPSCLPTGTKQNVTNMLTIILSPTFSGAMQKAQKLFRKSKGMAIYGLDTIFKKS